MTGNEAFTAVCAAFESLGKVVVLLDEEMRIVQASPALRGLLSTPDPEGRYVSEFIDAPEFLDCLRSGRRCDGSVSRIDGRFLTACGGVLIDGSFAPAARYLVSFELDDGAATVSEEAQLVIRALEANRWRRSAAAKSLGISRATLWRRMRELGI
ncbi:MAG TPA: helix-turn-helix domain-containing protein [Thermoanaerobaculia bacterium]|nr:helix-turn-helix domain-containing protein [Thermoanaerobaculia bacterium]